MAMSRIKLSEPQEDAWDMGLSDLIEETPNTENRKTRFRASTVNGEDNVVLMRPEPSWKQK